MVWCRQFWSRRFSAALEPDKEPLLFVDVSSPELRNFCDRVLGSFQLEVIRHSSVSHSVLWRPGNNSPMIQQSNASHIQSLLYHVKPVDRLLYDASDHIA